MDLSEVELFVGRYKILKEVGQGGQGAVYRAQDVESGRTVALKLIHSRLLNTSARVLSVSCRVAQIRHPNVATLVDFGTTPGGAYVVTDWIDGNTLRSIIDQRRLSLVEILAIAGAIVSALEAVHRAGGIHEDIKPSNVIVPTENGQALFGRAVLVDFGSFRRIRDRYLTGVLSTRIGEIAGTPKYMAPEQCGGRARTTATDLYLLGTLIFELVFGEPPMAGESCGAVQIDTSDSLVMAGPLIRAKLTRDIEIPTSDDVPNDLRRLLAELLQRDPKNRPRSATAVAGAIDQIKLIYGGS